MTIQDVEFDNEIEDLAENINSHTSKQQFKEERRNYYLGLDSTSLGDNSYTDEQINRIVEQEWQSWMSKHCILPRT